jgi:putative oxidoreductase
MQKIEKIFRIIIAFIFVQSLYYKFTGHAEAVHIFTTIGMEPFGRIFVGISELIVAILLFVPKTKILSLLGSIGLMCGAIFFHLSTELGVVVHWDGQNDNGTLFGMGVTVLILSTYMLIAYYKNNLPINSIKKIIGF